MKFSNSRERRPLDGKKDAAETANATYFLKPRLYGRENKSIEPAPEAP